MMTDKKPNQRYLGSSQKAASESVRSVTEDNLKKEGIRDAAGEQHGLQNQRNGVTPVEGVVRRMTSSQTTQPSGQEWEKWLETKLEQISRIVKERPNEKILSLMSLINEAHLKSCFRYVQSGKAPGIDGVTKEDYAKVMDERIPELIRQMKAFRYRPPAVRRVYIPKPDGTKRPLGIPTLESKLVQHAMRRVLDAVYEPMFLDSSYGFRRGRSAHDALRRVQRMMQEGRTNYIVEADIRHFFDEVDHKKLIQLLEKKIDDRSLIRYVVRFLRSGVMEEGRYLKTKEGTPQGGVISPLLANVFLLYVLDSWFYGEYRKNLKGHAELIRYADDFLAGFENKEEAEAFLLVLDQRLKEYGLQLHKEKTRIVPFSPRKFGKRSGTFEFLGFLHYVGLTRRGIPRVKRQTSSKKMRMKLKQAGQWLKANRSRLTLSELHERLSNALRGHFRYYGVSDNFRKLGSFLYFIKGLFFKWINRRSQRKSMTGIQFEKYLNRHPFPRPRIWVNLFSPITRTV